MVDRRRKNGNWCPADENGVIPTWDRIGIAVLMDIRDELQIVRDEIRVLNQVFECPNFLAIPRTLQKIAANTAKPRKAKP